MLKGRITPNTINILMLDAEVENIKKYMDLSTGGSTFQGNCHQGSIFHILYRFVMCIVNNEFVAIHADRYLEGAKFIRARILGRKAKFRRWPFCDCCEVIASTAFVFAAKDGKNTVIT